MSLAWIAAVLRPQDLLPARGGEGPPVEAAAARLAELVKGPAGRPFNEPSSDDAIEPGDGAALQHVEHSMLRGSIHEGLAGLRSDILDHDHSDRARAGALALLACCAAAALDDYETCEQLIDAVLKATPERDADTRLIRAILIQQLNLRSRDMAEWTRSSAEVLRLLDSFSPTECSRFPVARRAGDSTATIQRIVDALRQAAISLMPETQRAEIPLTARGPQVALADQFLNAYREAANIYAKMIKSLFERTHGRRRLYKIGSDYPDLFHSVLVFELYGHQLVYRARRDLAILRLTEAQLGFGERDLADAVRLLRHSNQTDDLALALRQLRFAGPLAAVSQDARQILKNRMNAQLREPELTVLQAGAELFTNSEASVALDGIVSLIERGGPEDMPGHHKVGSARVEPAWLAASAMGNSADDPDRALTLLLRTTQQYTDGDELLDRSIARALQLVEWDRATEAARDQWITWTQAERSGWRVTAGTVRSKTGTAFGAADRAVEVTDLDSAADALNAILAGGQLAESTIAQIERIVRPALSEIRASAASGRYAYRVVEPADLAAVLVARTGATDLWPALAEFLMDPLVQRSDRSPGFERLTRERPEIPVEVAGFLRGNAHSLLFEAGPDQFFGASDISPFPAALRFFATSGLIDEATVFGHVARLAGDDDPAAREEAARTLAALAEVNPTAWVAAISLQLSHDSHVAGKAHAVHALALLGSDPQLAPVILDRLAEVVEEDGILVAVALLSGLEKGNLAAPVISQLERLREHPSRVVRMRADRLLGA